MNEWRHHSSALGYWAPLHEILHHRLGWSDPGRGLMWWYDHGKPQDDPTLALVAELWDRDGLLDPYLAWLLGWRSRHAALPEVEPLTPAWRRWLTHMRETWDATRYPYIKPEGDELHLYRSGLSFGDPDRQALLLEDAVETRRAVLATRHGDSWYATLAASTAELPPVPFSWRVHVYVHQLGFMGEFRRSLVTGLWFCGRHHVHSVGNPAGPASHPQGPW